MYFVFLTDLLPFTLHFNYPLPVAVMEMHKLRNWTMQTLEATDPNTGTAIKFSDVCSRDVGDDGTTNGGPCSSASTGITLAGKNNGVSNDLAVSSWNVAGVTSLYDMTGGFAIKNVVTPATLDSNGQVASSSALLMTYSIIKDTDGDEKQKLFELAWNKDIVAQADASILKVTHWSLEGLNSESGRSVGKEIPLFVIAMNLVGFFLSLTLGGTRTLKCCGFLKIPFPDLVRGRFELAWMGVMVVGLATGAGFGCAALFGVTFHSICSLMPLVALGVQVDDCIITVNMVRFLKDKKKQTEGFCSLQHFFSFIFFFLKLLQLAKTVKGKGGFEERFGKAARESGPCVTTTSMTTVVAFALGIPSALPGVSFFCSYAASVFFFGWLFQVTFFWACLVIDEQRIERSRDCITCCIRVPAKTAIVEDENATTAKPTNHQSSFNHGLKIYGNVLLHPVVAGIVVLLFVCLTAAAVALVGNTPVGLPLEDILPDDSFIRAAFKTREDVFGGQVASVTVVVKDQDFNDLAVRTNFIDASNQVAALTDVVVKLPTWMDSYDGYKAATGTTNRAVYLDKMKDFLASKYGWSLTSDVKCVDPDKCTSLKSANFRTLFMMSQPGKTLAEELPIRNAIDKVMRANQFPADETVVHNGLFMFGETDLAMWSNILQTCGFALIGIFVCVAITSSIATSFLITLTVAMIEADLLLAAYLSGLRVNSISYACLVMAGGLAVDYCVHLGHAFDHAVREENLDNKAAARKAITRMGASILQGGLTTLLGISVLAAASSVAFRSFFLYVFSTIIFGVAHGMIFLPILLGYLTPRCSGDDGDKKDDSSVKNSGGGGGGGAVESVELAAVHSKE